MFIRTALIHLLVILNAVVSAEEDQPAGFPAPLTADTFKPRLSHGLHLVEFFSPYCVHCKHLAPVWEKTWEVFHEEGENLGIGMAQVDCVASGDLCNEHKITGYPSLKLYGPDGYIKDYPRTAKRKKEAFIKFMRDSAAKHGDANFQVKSKSKLLSTDQMIELLGNEHENPYLVSFWPSYTLEDLDKYEIDKYDTPFDELCVDLQRTWAVVSNQVETLGFNAGHFNCLNNRKICTELGFDLQKPHVAIMLPNMPIAQFIKLDEDKFDFSVKDIRDFAERTLQAANPPYVDITSMVEKIPSRLPGLFDFPTEAETSIVYYYDDLTTTQEDWDLLPYLIEPLSKLPTVRLYKSNDSRLMNLARVQKKGVYRLFEDKKDFTRAAPDDPSDVIPGDDRIEFELATTLPTLIAFQNVLQMPKVFQSFAPSDIRDQYRVIDWINDQSAPPYMEFNSDTYRAFVNGPDHNEYFALLLLDPTTNDDANLQYQKEFLVGAHEYTTLKDEDRFHKVEAARKKKEEALTKLKANKASARKINDMEARAIPYEQGGDLTLGWLDLNKHKEFIQTIGCNVNEIEHEAGDVIIIDMIREVYYEEDSHGEPLNVRVSRTPLTHTLTTLRGLTNGKLRAVKRHSLFGPSLRWADSLLETIFNRWTVFSVIVLLVFIFKRPRWKLFHLHFRRKLKDNRGILGIPDAKKE